MVYKAITEVVMAKNKDKKSIENTQPEVAEEVEVKSSEEVQEPTVEELLDAERARTKEMKELAQRVQAEYENYRKRNVEAVKQSRVDGENSMLIDMLVVMDSFDRALMQIEEGAERQGLEKIQKQFLHFFETKGVKEIEAVGKKFDPTIHNAIMTVDDSDNVDMVVEVLQKGYTRDNKILRAPLVKVAK